MGWLKKLVTERAASGNYIAADPARYCIAHKAKGVVSKSYHQTIRKVANEYKLTLVLGPRGGYWSAIYAPTTMIEASEELQLRHLGQEMISLGGVWPWDPSPTRPVWRIRKYRGQLYLCLKPRERRWYDPPWGYLVS